MYIELAIALGLGAVVALVILKKRKNVLKAQDGWWGVGACPQGPEDDSIHPFKVETTPEEIEVNPDVIIRIKFCIIISVEILFGFVFSKSSFIFFRICTAGWIRPAPFLLLKTVSLTMASTPNTLIRLCLIGGMILIGGNKWIN